MTFSAMLGIIFVFWGAAHESPFIIAKDECCVSSAMGIGPLALGWKFGTGSNISYLTALDFDVHQRAAIELIIIKN